MIARCRIDGSLIPRYGRARRDPSLAVLEGLHPLKHALRFGATVLDVVCSDLDRLERLASQLAPDVCAQIVSRSRMRSPRRCSPSSRPWRRPPA